MNIVTTDIDLERQTKLGNRHAFNILVIKHKRKLAYAISRYLKLPQHIEDVDQESFIKAYSGIMAFRGDSRFSTWLHRIGINTAIDFLAAEHRHIPHYQPALNAETNEPIVSKIVDQGNPEQLLANNQIAKTFSSTLKKLPEKLRKAITLREIDGLNYEEIANIMNCPIGIIRSRIYRDRKEMVAILRN